MLFGFIGACHLINLDRDTGHLQRMQRRLAAQAIPFTRIPGVLVPPKAGRKMTDGHVGTGMAHIRALQLAADQQLSSVLIVEDDVVFRDDTAEVLWRVGGQLCTLPWELLYFGPSGCADGPQVAANAIEAWFGIQTHAYIVNGPAITQAIAIIEDSLRRDEDYFDADVARSALRKYAVRPVLAIQDDTGSATGPGVDKLVDHLGLNGVNELVEHCGELQYLRRAAAKIRAERLRYS